MNKTISARYNLAPETIEKRNLNPNDGKYFQEIYDFVRLRKIENNQIRNDKYNQKIDRRKRTLSSLLNLDKNFLVLAKRLKKKDPPGNLYKASTENMPFFNRNRIFTRYKRAKLNNGPYLYWEEEDDKKINGRFLRQELFAINDQFEKWIQILFKEITLDENNKFVLDFSDEEFIQKIDFNKKITYYIASLDCNLILKEHIKKDKIKK